MNIHRLITVGLYVTEYTQFIRGWSSALG